MCYLIVEETQRKNDEITARVVAEAKSPWFSGHFPGDPILPGIALLKMVADTIAAGGEADLRMTGLRRVKFRKIVRPGEPLDLYAVPGKERGQYAFRISSGADEVCSGLMLLAHEDNLQKTT